MVMREQTTDGDKSSSAGRCVRRLRTRQKFARGEANEHSGAWPTCIHRICCRGVNEATRDMRRLGLLLTVRTGYRINTAVAVVLDEDDETTTGSKT